MLAHSLKAALAARGVEAVLIAPATLDQVRGDLDRTSDRGDLVLLDFDLGPAGSALPLIGPLARGGSTVVLMSGSADDAQVGAGLEAGAVGFLSKADDFDALLRSIVTVSSGGRGLSDADRLRFLRALAEHRRDRDRVMHPFHALTPREAEVLHRLCGGAAPQAIARADHVSVATIRSQVRSILLKLGVNSQLEAVVKAYRSGWHPAAEDRRVG